MDQNSKYLTIEMRFSVRMKNYKVVIGMKRAWIAAIFAAVIQIAMWLINAYN